MIQLVLDGTEARFDVAQTLAKRELTECQTQKLIATREAALSFVPVVSPDACIEFVSWKKLHDLRKHQLFYGHHPLLAG
jgi:hypothetical protein